MELCTLTYTSTNTHIHSPKRAHAHKHVYHRCEDTFLKVFAEVGLKVIKKDDQKEFPKELFRVTM